MTDLEITLCAEYESWLSANGMTDAGSADELLHDDITTEQRRWLTDFILRWDAMREGELV